MDMELSGEILSGSMLSAGGEKTAEEEDFSNSVDWDVATPEYGATEDVQQPELALEHTPSSVETANPPVATQECHDAASIDYVLNIKQPGANIDTTTPTGDPSPPHDPPDLFGDNQLSLIAEWNRSFDDPQSARAITSSPSPAVKPDQLPKQHAKRKTPPKLAQRRIKQTGAPSNHAPIRAFPLKHRPFQSVPLQRDRNGLQPVFDAPKRYLSRAAQLQQKQKHIIPSSQKSKTAEPDHSPSKASRPVPQTRIATQPRCYNMQQPDFYLQQTVFDSMYPSNTPQEVQQANNAMQQTAVDSAYTNDTPQEVQQANYAMEQTAFDSRYVNGAPQNVRQANYTVQQTAFDSLYPNNNPQEVQQGNNAMQQTVFDSIGPSYTFQDIHQANNTVQQTAFGSIYTNGTLQVVQQANSALQQTAFHSMYSNNSSQEVQQANNAVQAACDSIYSDDGPQEGQEANDAVQTASDSTYSDDSPQEVKQANSAIEQRELQDYPAAFGVDRNHDLGPQTQCNSPNVIESFQQHANPHDMHRSSIQHPVPQANPPDHLQLAEQLVQQQTHPEPTAFPRVPQLINFISDVAALRVPFYKDVPATEEARRESHYLLLTHRLVRLLDASYAYNRGYWPRSKEIAYAHPPASNPHVPHDTTSHNPYPLGLAQYSAGLLPLPIAWIDEPRGMTLPNPATLIPGPLRDDKGNVQYGINGEALRDLKLLPRKISTAVEGWRLHFWFTLDKRIKYSDIIARMHFRCTPHGGDGPLACGLGSFTAVLEHRISKFRRESGILKPMTDLFNPETYTVTAADVEVVRKLTNVQLQYGTWWNVNEVMGVMYCPRPKDAAVPWEKVQYILPEKAWYSPRVLCIKVHIERMQQRAERLAMIIPRDMGREMAQVQEATPTTKSQGRKRSAEDGMSEMNTSDTSLLATPAQPARKTSTSPTSNAAMARSHAPSVTMADWPADLQGLGANRQFEALHKHSQLQNGYQG